MGASLSYPTVDLSGKVVIVTGGNTGIGYETAKATAVMGAHTIIACRSEERATAAVERMKEEVRKELPDKEITVEFMKLDLASFQSTKDFIRAFKEKNLPLNILINNAAVGWTPFTKTDDGFEIQFQVNHLSAFLLTLELLPIILDSAAATGDARIVFMASTAHGNGIFNPNNLNSEQEYSRLRSYPNSKLNTVLSVYALQRRLQDVGVTVSATDPGFVKTDFAARNFPDQVFLSFFQRAAGTVFGRTAKEGAATTVNAAVNPDLNSQQAVYYDSCRPKVSSADSRNEQYQEELWRRSIDFLREHLSPEILEKYGAAQTQPAEAELAPVGTEAPSPDSTTQAESTATHDEAASPESTAEAIEQPVESTSAPDENQEEGTEQTATSEEPAEVDEDTQDI